MLYYTKIKHIVFMHPGLRGFTHRETSSHVSDNDRNIGWTNLTKFKAKQQLEGSVSCDRGYVIRVIGIENGMGKGLIMPQSGLIQYDLTCKVINLFPLKGEVVDAIVTEVRTGRIIFCYGGLIYGVVAFGNFCIEDDYDYKEEACVGEDDVATMVPCFVSFSNRGKVIKEGSVVRLRIVRRKFGPNGFWLEGTMKNQFLGLQVEKEMSSLQTFNLPSRIKNSVDDIKIEENDKALLELVD